MASSPVKREHLTTAEAADLLQVSVATLRRWAQSGLLPSERTEGGHRRFRLEDVRALAAPVGADAGPAVLAADALARAETVIELESWLLHERRERGSWWEVNRSAQAAVAELYRRRSAGGLTGIQLEAILDRLRTATLRFLESAPVVTTAPVLLLAAVPGDPFLVAAAFLALAAAESGWRPRWAGHPSVTDLAEELARAPVQAIVVTCSPGAATEAAARLGAELDLLARTSGLPVAALGAGAWPHESPRVPHLDSGLAARDWLATIPGRELPAKAWPAADADAPLGWSPSLALGHPALDAQHRTLFEQAALFSAALQRGAHAEEGVAMLRFIGDYALVHFRLEEQAMRESDFPELPQHLLEHEEFTRRLAALEREFELAGRTAAALLPLAAYLSAWLRRHVGDSDQRLGVHLRGRTPPAA